MTQRRPRLAVVGQYIAAVALLVTACSSSSTVANETSSGDSSTTSADDELALTGESSPTEEGSSDLGPFVRCSDIPELTATVEGSLDQFANPDDEVVGVLLTYGLEHPDTYAGFWTDRSKGGTLVLAFTDDPAPHLAAILARGPSPDDVEVVIPMPPIRDPRPLGERDDVAVDVVQATFTEGELMAASERFWSDRPPPYVLGGGIDTKRNRIAVDLIDPTADQLADLADRVPSEMTCVNVTISNETPPPVAALDDLQVIVVPDSEGRLPPDSELQCNDSVRFPASALDDMPLVADAAMEVAMASFLESGEGGFWPQDRWRLLHEGDDQAIVVHAEPGGEAGVSLMTLERSDDQWQLGVVQSGPCPLRAPLPSGMNAVEWRLDPAAPAPTPDSTAIELLLIERECTSGQAIGDRLVGPEVVVTDDAVLVAFAAISLPGDQTCPGNPEQPIMVELPQALGDRAVVDGLSVVGDLTDFVGS